MNRIFFFVQTTILADLSTPRLISIHEVQEQVLVSTPENRIFQNFPRSEKIFFFLSTKVYTDFIFETGWKIDTFLPARKMMNSLYVLPQWALPRVCREFPGIFRDEVNFFYPKYGVGVSMD